MCFAVKQAEAYTGVFTFGAFAFNHMRKRKQVIRIKHGPHIVAQNGKIKREGGALFHNGIFNHVDGTCKQSLFIERIGGARPYNARKRRPRTVPQHRVFPCKAYSYRNAVIAVDRPIDNAVLMCVVFDKRGTAGTIIRRHIGNAVAVRIETERTGKGGIQFSYALFCFFTGNERHKVFYKSVIGGAAEKRLYVIEGFFFAHKSRFKRVYGIARIGFAVGVPRFKKTPPVFFGRSEKRSFQQHVGIRILQIIGARHKKS